MSDGIQWWGYRHTSGTIHLKRYFSRRDIDEAIDSDFVAHVFGPFEAETHEQASERLRKGLGEAS